MAKKAKLIAVAVEVHCPYCDNPLGNPHDGSFMWERPQVSGVDGKAFPFRCAACGKDFDVSSLLKVDFI